MEILAPMKFTDSPRPWIFLAGSIEMGKARDWQTEIADALPNCTVLNPRRDDWDSSWIQSIDNEQFREQVEWELKAQEEADLILVHFEPEALAPITMMELGLFRAKAVVHCPEGFWRKGNVDIVCKRYGIPMVKWIEELVQAVSTHLKTSCEVENV